MTHEEIAWEFAEIFEELDVAETNEMLAKNIPMETLAFFSEYTRSFADAEELDGRTRDRLPNLMMIGYLIRVLEQRLMPKGGTHDA